MSPFHPDLFTAAGMTAMAALLLAWVLRVQGAAYMRQGVAWATSSSVFTACACMALMWRLAAGHAVHVHLLVLLLLSAALASLSLAIHRFHQPPQRTRDLACAAVPLGALLLLAVGQSFFAGPWAAMASAGVLWLQTLYLAFSLQRMRSAAPGPGWKMLACSAWAMVLAGAALFMLNRGVDTPAASAHGSAFSAIQMWVVCSVPMLVLAVASLGFLRMLHDRDHAAEQGLSQLDALTQLPNRAALVVHLQKTIELAATHSQPMALMVLDIDHFKSVNDSYGHLIGDHVIQRIARTLVQQARTGDFSARYGGEEFVVVLPNTGARDAFHLAERLCQAVRKAPMPLPSGKLLHITVSVGVYAGHPTHGNSWERMVAAADEAMYVAKRSGRDRVAMSAPIQAMQPSGAVPV